jgi:hypothetical protein
MRKPISEAKYSLYPFGCLNNQEIEISEFVMRRDGKIDFTFTLYEKEKPLHERFKDWATETAPGVMMKENMYNEILAVLKKHNDEQNNSERIIDERQNHAD